MQYTDFLDLDYEPDDDDVIVKYRVEFDKRKSMEKVVGGIAAESSIGTWTEVSTMNEEIKELRARVFSIDSLDKGVAVKIAYPNELFEPGNMPQILSSLAGNVFGMKLLRNLRLEDIRFPKNLLRSFKGPRLGIWGIRNSLRVRDRPLLGTIVKPKVGLTSREHAEVAYKAWKGGLDLVKEDENLGSMNFNPFQRRVIETLESRDRAEEESGERKGYLPNITSSVSEMKKRTDFVIDNGGKYVMIDFLSLGWSAFQEIRDYLEHERIAIHLHRAGHAALDRNPRHGISMLVLAKLARIIGGDQLHIGVPKELGKMESKSSEVLKIAEEIKNKEEKEERKPLEQDWNEIKRVLPICSGGLHPAVIPKLIEIMGKDVVIQAGGGCHGHPDGTENGARAMKQALEASLESISLEEYARNHEELKKALRKWG